METKYITIPFDVERAKRITSGIELGKIVTKDGSNVRIVCFDVKGEAPILGLIDKEDREGFQYYDERGKIPAYEYNKLELMLKIPEWATYKDGDIIYCEVDNGDSGVCKWVSILKGKVECSSGDLYTNEYATYIIDPNTYKGEMSFDGYSDNIDTIVLANESQKQYFIELLKKSKDPKAKECLKKLGIEKMKECEFKPFDKVLVRNDDGDHWRIDLFAREEIYFPHRFICMFDKWKYCIPYEGNEHLLGVTNNPD